MTINQYLDRIMSKCNIQQISENADLKKAYNTLQKEKLILGGRQAIELSEELKEILNKYQIIKNESDKKT